MDLPSSQSFPVKSVLEQSHVGPFSLETQDPPFRHGSLTEQASMLPSLTTPCDNNNNMNNFLFLAPAESTRGS